MLQLSKVLLRLFTAVGSFSTSLNAITEQIALENSVGESYVIEVNADDSFGEVIDTLYQSVAMIESQTIESNSNIDLDQNELRSVNVFRMKVGGDGSILVKAILKNQASASFRNYEAGMASQDQTDITYIVKTLANETLIKIKSSESSLKKAGDRVDHVHPLNFLHWVFSNEELKVGIRIIQDRSWVGKSFMEGLTKCLSQEGAKGNIMPHVQHFATRLKIDANKIIPLLQAGQWEKFVKTLIDIIPRNGDTGRYDQ